MEDVSIHTLSTSVITLRGVAIDPLAGTEDNNGQMWRCGRGAVSLTAARIVTAADKPLSPTLSLLRRGRHEGRAN